VSLNGLSQDGFYDLIMTVSDGVNIIGNSTKYIEVLAGRVVSLMPPTPAGSDAFAIRIENFSDSEAYISGSIRIYDDDGSMVAELPRTSGTIDAGRSETLTVPWTPPDDLPAGWYAAESDVYLNNAWFFLRSEPFPVVRLRDAVTILKSLTADEHAHADMDGDGKTGTEDAIFILQAVAGMRN